MNGTARPSGPITPGRSGVVRGGSVHSNGSPAVMSAGLAPPAAHSTAFAISTGNAVLNGNAAGRRSAFNVTIRRPASSRAMTKGTSPARSTTSASPAGEAFDAGATGAPPSMPSAIACAARLTISGAGSTPAPGGGTITMPGEPACAVEQPSQTVTSKSPGEAEAGDAIVTFRSGFDDSAFSRKKFPDVTSRTRVARAGGTTANRSLSIWRLSPALVATADHAAPATLTSRVIDRDE